LSTGSFPKQRSLKIQPRGARDDSEHEGQKMGIIMIFLLEVMIKKNAPSNPRKMAYQITLNVECTVNTEAYFFMSCETLLSCLKASLP